MAKFFVGQRVRKVRGRTDVGVTGRIIAIDHDCPYGYTLLIRTDWAVRITGIEFDEGRGLGAEAWGNPDHWEPILHSGHRAGEEGKCELLDELLERQREVA